MKGTTKAEDIRRSGALDPVLAMLGVGKEIWTGETADQFVDRLRSEDVAPPPLVELPSEDLAEVVWHRIQRHQGEEFRTATGLPFLYSIEGAGIWFFRSGQRINRKLTQGQLREAIRRCPLTTTTEIRDLIDYAYLFGLLTDRRIRGDAW
jgi:hypothetical protein